MRADVTAEHLTQVVRDIAVIDIDDGVAFNLDTSSVQEIRERADYPGLRVRVAMSVGPWQGIAAWDVSTGEPIAPWPTRVTIDRIIGEPITLLGYAPETIIAEKGVTILERGITSTRWRDYVDIVQLDRRGIDDRAAPLGQGSRTIPRRHSRTRRASPGRLWRSRASEMGDRTRTLPALLETLETSPCREEKHGSAGRKTSFGDDRRSRRHSTALAALGHRTGELHLGTARRVPARRGVALDLKAGERNSTLSWRPTTNCVIGLPG